MKRNRIQSKKGFSLIELMVVLVIIGVLAAVGIPSAVNYIKLSEFRENEANAKTVYMAAESSLTWYRNSGQWDTFKDEVVHRGVENESFANTDDRYERIYAITLDSNSYGEDKTNPVYKLLDGMSYEKDFLNAAIAIEIDIDTGQVYSAFYGTKCSKLVYGEPSGEALSMDEEYRAYDVRKENALGYYSVDDVTNVVDLEPTRLKVTSINLQNNETLALSWSSNSRHQNLDIDFAVEIKQKETNEVLFSTVVNLADIMGTTGSVTTTMAELELKIPSNAVDENEGIWHFPLTYKNGTFTLVLDGMMSAQMIGKIDSQSEGEQKLLLQQTSDMSITRLQAVAPELASPQDIYATIKAVATYENMGEDSREYRTSFEANSNEANTLFGAKTETDAAGKLTAYITKYRHLSNMRYIADSTIAEFILNTKRLDWTAEDVGYFDYAPVARSGIMYPNWKSSSDIDGGLDFPMIEELYENHTLRGNGSETVIMNLKLGEESVLNDAQINALYSTLNEENRPYTKYVGLFGTVKGTIEQIVLQNPVLEIDEPAMDLASGKTYSHLKGAGLICGISEGNLRQITVDSTQDASTVKVMLTDRTAPAAVGGIVGVLAKEGAGNYTALSGANALAKELVMSGTVTARLPETVEDTNGLGIGGIFGYGLVAETDKTDIAIQNNTNRADVTGNLFTGGIGGQLSGNYESESDGNSILSCRNEGLVLCSAKPDDENAFVSKYFGGILGFGRNVCVYDSVNAAGQNNDYKYEVAKKDSLKGQYVGGIMGYGKGSILMNCGTEKGAYILGSDYVGGIVGGLEGTVDNVIQTSNGVTSTINAGYVIGNNYVGGIIGKNDGISAGDKSSIKNCINNGVAAGYEKYIGGIVGYNGEFGVIEDCASYIADYDDSIFDMIVEQWNATGDFTGGVVGYNAGEVKFSNENQGTTIQSVSSIVVGDSYVGGVIGFNDVTGSFKAEDILIGGRVYAYGNAAGGCIGANTSVALLEEALSITSESVRGRYYVGGYIGANIVEVAQSQDEKKVTVMGGVEVDNGLGKITGEAFVGGVIGYQRTYTSAQLKEEAGREISVYNYLTEKDVTPLLPKLDEADNTLNTPTEVLPSNNSGTLRITRISGDNKNNDLSMFNNNIAIEAYLYAGGVVGYCEPGSKLELVNCKNMGRLSLPASNKFTDSRASEGVSLHAFLGEYLAGRESNGIDADALLKMVTDQKVTMIGGISGINLENHTIDHCENTGSMNGFTALGGIVGTNAGRVFNCELADNLGSTQNDGIGGIVGINLYPLQDLQDKTYTDYSGKDWVDVNAGTIANCTASVNKTVLGKNYVGGIAGYNLYGAVLRDNSSAVNITAAGESVGGIAGINDGYIYVAEDQGGVGRTITGTGNAVGGLVGHNKKNGSIIVQESQNANEITVVGTDVTIIGNQNVGGIVGNNEGTLEAQGGTKVMMAVKAEKVQAKAGNAGGIAGSTTGEVKNAVNYCEAVTADKGNAGGIVAEAKKDIINCHNYGSVNSDTGYAGGIAAVNHSKIQGCSVEGKNGEITIRSQNVEEIGAVCAVNKEGAVIGSEKADAPDNNIIGANVKLQGAASNLNNPTFLIGGIAGINKGTIKNIKIDNMPAVSVTGTTQYVGAVTGSNQSTITNVQAGVEFKNFDNYKYLGGIAGENTENCEITNCTYSGTMSSTSASKAGNCYGGITGNNRGTLSDCQINGITMDIVGVYTATSTSSAEQKEKLASHVGGIAGKNEAGASIEECYLNNENTSKITVANGMAGAVTGYNKGTIYLSGDSITKSIMKDNNDNLVQSVEQLYTYASNKGIKSDIEEDIDNYIQWPGNGILNAIEGGTQHIGSLTYNKSGKGLTSGRSLIMLMTTNGNLGGITAYNAPTGKVDYCATGNWFMNNKSEAIGVGTGGIIGMNESVEDLSYLLNQSFVGRQVKKGKDDKGNATEGQTNRFSGGIIGNQNVSLSSDWRISSCINFGTVYNYRTHYAGGILGQWTSAGGNIEDCRNYGLLQTTYQASWQGASAGIVAQLYHPYENDEYNIISCNNYGNIYGRNGRDTSNCANDSAGILGNVTTYKVDSSDKSQNFTIQLLDCLNAPGVEIYSGSMASGIVGYISCDAPSASAIEISSMNMMLRIERCRNFASQLKGAQFVGGILGDRYGVSGGDAAKTVLKNCFSVYPGSNDYSAGKQSSNTYKECPIASLNAKEDSITKGTTEGNYYFISTSFNTALELSAGGNPYNAPLSAKRLDFVKIGNSYYAVDVTKTKNNHNSLTIDGTSIKSGNTTYGTVIFKTDKNYKVNNSTTCSEVVKKDSGIDTYVREAYRRIEGPYVNNGRQMADLSGVTAARKDGKLVLSIAPSANSDPFMYTVSVSQGDKEGQNYQPIAGYTDMEFYSENIAISLPQSVMSSDGKLQVSVTAHSMYEDDIDPVDPSEPYTVVETDNIPVLPTPDIRIELVKSNNSYKYQYSLNNVEEFKALRDIWSVNILFSNGESVVLDSDKLTAVYNGMGANAQQLLVQTVPKGNQLYLESAQVSVPAYLPNNVPAALLSNMTRTYTTSGTTLEELAITVSLGYASGCEIPPVYRCELIGTWMDKNNVEHKNVTFASNDILIAANGTATATFTNLPEYITEVDDLMVRVWYAESGLGPVYTYSDVAAESNANIQILAGIAEDGTEEWKYQTSVVIAEKNGGFKNCYQESGVLVKWLPAPELKDVGVRLEPIYKQGRLHYSFAWDADAAKGTQYQISLTGLDANNNKVTIKNNETVTLQSKGGSYEIDADDWNYSEVELTVTRIGNEANKEIGLTSKGTYPVSKRLPKPGQPTVTIADVNELNYRVEWAKVTPETGCVSYQVYLQEYDEDGKPVGEAKAIGDAVAQDSNSSGFYKTIVDLEDYHGKRVQIYVVAQADETLKLEEMEYVHSTAGVTYELLVPNRIKEPVVKWLIDWLYDKLQFKTISEFEQEGMNVSVTADENSIPGGGSAYLLRAYVYADKAAADNAITKNDFTTDSLTVYPQDADGKIVPVQMNATSTNVYSHALKDLSSAYAGKWVVFQTRISSGSGQISSVWVTSEPMQLPYVKLDKPVVSGDVEQLEQLVKTTTNPDLPQVEENWLAEHHVFTFESGKNAETYYITLSPKDKTAYPTVEYRIVEDISAQSVRVFVKTETAGEGDAVSYQWTELASVLEGNTYQFNLSDYGEEDSEVQKYKMHINEKYDKAGTYIYYETDLISTLRAEFTDSGKFRYKLSIPDIIALTARTMTEGEEGSETVLQETVLPETNFTMTETIVIRSDINANADIKIDGIAETSDSYITSEEIKIIIGD